MVKPDRKENMKVLEKATIPDGIKIQIEDWTQDYDCFKTLSIATYPVALRNPVSKTVPFFEVGRIFRVSINREWKNNDEVRSAFEELKNGKKSIKDFKNQFWNPWNIECL